MACELVTERNRCHRPHARHQALTGSRNYTGRRFLGTHSPPTLGTRSLSDGVETIANEQQRQLIEERTGNMVEKIIVLAILCYAIWAYSTTFLAQVRLL